MAARRSPCTSPCPTAAAEAEVQTAQEEPMHIWSHPIPTCVPSGCCPAELSVDLGPVLEELRCQSRLLVDLLGAVNALTAATLSRPGKI